MILYSIVLGGSGIAKTVVMYNARIDVYNIVITYYSWHDVMKEWYSLHMTT